MTFWNCIDALARGLGYLSILGILAALGIWALYTADNFMQRRAARKERRHIDRVLRAYEKELR